MLTLVWSTPPRLQTVTGSLQRVRWSYCVGTSSFGRGALSSSCVCRLLVQDVTFENPRASPALHITLRCTCGSVVPTRSPARRLTKPQARDSSGPGHVLCCATVLCWSWELVTAGVASSVGGAADGGPTRRHSHTRGQGMKAAVVRPLLASQAVLISFKNAAAHKALKTAYFPVE